jgi:hypothetical protein
MNREYVVTTKKIVEQRHIVTLKLGEEPSEREIERHLERKVTNFENGGRTGEVKLVDRKKGGVIEVVKAVRIDV